MGKSATGGQEAAVKRSRPRPGDKSRRDLARSAAPPESAQAVGSRDRAWWPFALAIVLAVGALVHWPALRTFFAQDDVTFLARAMGLEPTPWSLVLGMSVCVAEIRYRLESGTGKLKLGFADNSLTKEAGR